MHKRFTIMQNKTHYLLDLVTASVLLVELERVKLTDQCAKLKDETQRGYATCVKLHKSTKRLFKQHKQPMPDYLTSPTQSGVDGSSSSSSSSRVNRRPPTVTGGYNDVVNDIEKRAIAEQEIRIAKTAAVKELDLQNREKIARDAMRQAMQKAEDMKAAAARVGQEDASNKDIMAARAAQERERANAIANATAAKKKATQELTDVNRRLKNKRLTGHLSYLLQ